MLYLGADHRGYSFKEKLKIWLSENNIFYEDLGNKKFNKDDDFVDFAEIVGKKVIQRENNKGILFCGSGIGVTIAANKIKGVRAGCVFNKEMAKKAVEHDDINIICFPADYLSFFIIQKCVESFLSGRFLEDKRYLRRKNKITLLEKKG